MKIGLDFHGVLDTYPELFSAFSGFLVTAGAEVHVITGSRITPELEAELLKLGIQYTHLFSITDYQASIGTLVTNDDEGRPWLDDVKWNRTKADYCERTGIDLHIDDSPRYGKYFTGKTRYLLFQGEDGLRGVQKFFCETNRRSCVAWRPPECFDGHTGCVHRKPQEE